MGIVTEAGFYDGKFLKSGQFDKAEEEVVATGVDVDSKTKETGSADLDAMTKDELLAEAARRDVPVKPSDTKAEIVAALKAAG